MIPAYAYARYSSDNQRDESIEDQFSYIETYAERSGYEIIERYSDYAVSGTKIAHRSQFQRMLEDVKERGEISAVLVYDLSRFARNTEDAIRIERDLMRHKVELVSVMQPLHTIKNGKVDASAVIYRNLLHVMNEASSLQNSETTAAHMYAQSQRTNEQGYHPHLAGMAPYGYKLSAREHYKDHRYLEINEKEAEAVLLAWQMVDDGQGYRRIADKLNDMGYRTRKGRALSISTIHEIVHNSIYAGIYQYGKIRYNRLTTGVAEANPDAVVAVGGVPAIIPMSLYERVAARNNARQHVEHASSAGNIYVLSGLIHCKYCGAAMIGDSHGGARSTMYRCTGSECRFLRWSTSAGATEKVVVRLMLDLFLREADPQRIAEAIDEYEDQESKDAKKLMDTTSADISTLEDKLSRLLDAYLDADIKSIVKARMLEAQAELNRKKQLLEQLRESAVIRQSRDDIDLVTTILQRSRDACRDWNAKVLRDICRVFILRIDVAHYGEMRITWANGAVTEVPPQPHDPGVKMRRQKKSKSEPASANVGSGSESLGTTKLPRLSVTGEGGDLFMH